MKRLLKYIASVAVTIAMMFAASFNCDTDWTPKTTQNNATFNDDGTMNVTVSMSIPRMTSATTRTLAGDPDFENLHLFLLVFEKNNDGAYQLRQLEEFAPGNEGYKINQPDATHDHDALTTFKVALEPTDREAVIHLIATDQPDFGSNISFGTEESVITSLCTTATGEQQYGAYWQRVDLESNIPTQEQAKGDPSLKTNLESALSHVPLVRNFCRVSVVNNSTDDFTLTGVYVLNTVDQGSVAPYMADKMAFVDSYNGKTYEALSQQGYIGSQPTGIKIINKLEDFDFKNEANATGIHACQATSKSEIELANAATAKVEPVYFYERFARPIDPDQTFVIIRGKYKGDAKETFYRIDIGYLRPGDEVGIFNYYNLLRNFDYAIQLNAVESSGYATLEEAANGVVYNNFSASVEARTMNSISDGEDMIFVNHTSFVFLRPGQTIELLAQFRTDITDGKGGTVRNDLLQFRFDDEKHEVIESVEEKKVLDPNPNDDNRDFWNVYTVKGSSNPGPTDELKWKTLYIYRGNKAAEGQPADYGLYREITFYSHLPWSFPHIDTFPGLWMSPDDIPVWDMEDEREREVGHSKGSELTLFFELPAGIPQALFPMEFAIESDRQNIQNAYAGNAVVRSVPANKSLFSEENKDANGKPSDWMKGNPTTTRIQYIKTVTWEDYNTDKSMGQVGTGSSLVRCRFLTITDLDQEGVGGGDKDEAPSASTTTLRVYNEHFGRLETDDNGNPVWRMYHDDKFTRDNTTSDPTPVIWDFSVSDDRAGLGMTGGTYHQDGGYYDNVSRFSISHNYPGSDPRTAVLVITTDLENRFTISASGGTGVSAKYSENGVEEVDGKYMHYMEINIPSAVKTLGINVTVPLPAQKLYKIEFYPRGYDNK